MGRPRPRPKVLKPSPLSQTHFTRPLSVAPPETTPEIGVVTDPMFWKRFSAVVHASEDEENLEKGGRGRVPTSSTVDVKEEDQWLVQQQKEKKRYRIQCMSITLVVLLIIALAAVVAWYFTQGPGRRH